MLEHVSYLVWLVAAPCVVVVPGPHHIDVSTVDLHVHLPRRLPEHLRGVDVVVADVRADVEDHPLPDEVVLKREACDILPSGHEVHLSIKMRSKVKRAFDILGPYSVLPEGLEPGDLEGWLPHERRRAPRCRLGEVEDSEILPVDGL